MLTQVNKRGARITFDRLGLFCLLFCTALLVNPGRIVGYDSIATLAATESFVQEGSWNTNTLIALEWPKLSPGSQGVFGGDGQLYSKKSPLVSVMLVPFVWLGKILPVVGVTQAALLLIPICYALNGVMIVMVGKRLGLTGVWPWLCALWWALGTYTLANSQEIFAEPVMAFGVTLMLYGMLGTTLRDVLLSGIGAGLLSGNLASLVLLPIPALYLVWKFWRLRLSLSAMVLRLAVWALPIVVCLSIVVYFNLLRTGTLFSSGYRFGAGEGFTTPLWAGVYGLILSGHRGVIWYAPVTVFLLPAAWMMRKRHEIWVMLSLIVVQLVVFGSWWSWEGGLVWGPRFLLPVLPLMVLLAGFSLPSVWRSRVGRAVLIALAGISILIQIPGTVIHYTWYEFELRASHGIPPDAPTLFNDEISDVGVINPLYSPILGTWRYLGQADALWPIWGYPLNNPHGSWVFLGLVSVVIAQVVLIFVGRYIVVRVFLCLLSACLVTTYAAQLTIEAETSDVSAYLMTYAQDGDRLIAQGVNAATFLFEIPSRPQTYTLHVDARPNDELSALTLDAIGGESRVWWLSSHPEPARVERRWAREWRRVQSISLGRYRLTLYECGRA